MKRIKKLIILTVVLALLIGGYFIVSNIADREEAAGDETTAEAAYTVAEVDAETLTSLTLSIRKSEGSTEITNLSFKLSSDATEWLWSEDETVPLDNNAFADIVTALNEGSSPVKMENVETSALADYGLDSPYIEAVFGYSDGTQYACKLGNYNSFNGMYYYADASDASVVYMIDSTAADAMDLTIFDFILEDELPEITEANINSVTVVNGSDSLVYTYYPNGNSAYYTDTYKWFLSVNSGKEFPVASELGDEIAAAVTSRSIMECVAYNTSSDEQYGLSSPIKVTVDYKKAESVTDSSSDSSTSTEVLIPAVYTFRFGGMDEDGYYYVRTEDSDLVYTLSYSDVFDIMIRNDEKETRPAELIAVNAAMTDEIAFTASGKTLTVSVTHSDGTDVYADKSGAVLDYDKFSAILEALGSTEAESYTSVLDADASVAKDELFSASFTFNTGDIKTAKLSVTRYTSEYCRVSFADRDDQLITLSDAEKLAQLVADYFG